MCMCVGMSSQVIGTARYFSLIRLNCPARVHGHIHIIPLCGAKLTDMRAHGPDSERRPLSMIYVWRSVFIHDHVAHPFRSSLIGGKRSELSPPLCEYFCFESMNAAQRFPIGSGSPCAARVSVRLHFSHRSRFHRIT